MKKKELFHLLNHPFQISFKEYQKLEEVSAKYPYFSILNAILAKAAKELNLPEAKERLHIAALQSIDRKVLKSLMEFKPEPVVEMVPIEKMADVEDLQKEPKKKKKKQKSEPETITEIDTSVIEAVVEPSSNDLNSEHQEIEEPKKKKQKKGVEDQRAIIDKFIESNVTFIKPGKIEPEDHEPIIDLTKTSASLPEDIVSENLAALLAKQGKKQKAIAAYEKLILKFPEKRTYFAALIEELKNS